MKIKKVLLLLLLVACISGACYSGYKLYGYYHEYRQGSQEYTKLQETVVTEQPSEEQMDIIDTDISEEIEPPVSVDFEKLQAINGDIVGWLYVGALDLSYPVVQGEDNQYYLHHTYEKTENFAGTLFADKKNAPDFSDPNTIIYGHNMKNGTMFGSLKKFKDQTVYDSEPHIWLLTPNANYQYEIFSAYTTAVNSDTYTLFQGTSDEFIEYLQKMKTNSQIQTADFNFNKEDKIITLSTCTNDDTTRYVVQAKRL